MLDKDFKTLIMYMVALKTKTIHPFQVAQIAVLQ